MSGRETKPAHAPSISTRVGRAEFDEHLFFGHRVFAELLGRTSYIGLVSISVGGPRLSDADCAMLDDVATCISFADPRVWPLKAARLGASFGSHLAGVATGLLCSEGALLGPSVVVGATKMLVDLERRLGLATDDAAAVDAETVRMLGQDGRLPGFGVPARPFDERFVALRERLIARGRTGGRFVRLAETMVAAVKRVNGTPPNIALLTSALLLDLGFEQKQAFCMTVILLQLTIVANAVEGAEQRAPVLQRLPDETVRYEGVAARVSPRALRAKT